MACALPILSKHLLIIFLFRQPLSELTRILNLKTVILLELCSATESENRNFTVESFPE